jgi:hypothetical protein
VLRREEKKGETRNRGRGTLRESEDKNGEVLYILGAIDIERSDMCQLDVMYMSKRARTERKTQSCHLELRTRGAMTRNIGKIFDVHKPWAWKGATCVS